MAKWIGKITFPDGTVAVLEGNGQWKSDKENLALYLNGSYSIGNFPALGLPTGWYCVSQAAADLKGKAEFPFKLQPLPEGTVS